MSEYRCGNCGEMYSFDEYMDLEMVPIDPDSPENGNESVCDNCGKGMTTGRFNLKKEVTSPSGDEIEVSTVSLLIGHGRRHDMWFETCLFFDGGSRVVDRYHTEEQAEEGHQKYVDKIDAGEYSLEPVGHRIEIDGDEVAGNE